MSDRQKQGLSQGHASRDRNKRAALAFVRQRTLKEPMRCSGVGLHTGRKVSISLFPAPENHGIVFHRTDIAGQDNRVFARWDKVIDTNHCTVLGNEEGVRISTVEHLMAALASRRIDNALIAIDGDEVPIMDGSAAPFVFLLECAGFVEQAEPRRYLRLRRTVSVSEADKKAQLAPAEAISFACTVKFDHPVISCQSFSVRMVESTFKTAIAGARTFGFSNELDRLRSLGLVQGGSLDNAILLDRKGIVNQEGLRYDNEFVRHKILDCIGDLALANAVILARFEGFCCGHRLNNKLLHALYSDPRNWEIVHLPVLSHPDLA